MRKVLGLVAAAAATLTVLSPAQAATKKYVVTVTAVGQEFPRVVDVSQSSKDNRTDRVTVSGKVSGGPVSGRSVSITAVNTNDRNARRSLGTAKLTSAGRFSTVDRPPVGGRWTYQVTRPASGSTRSGTASTYIDAFQWAYLWEFYGDGSSSVPASTSWVERLYPAGPGQPDTRERVDGVLSSTQYAINGGATAGFDIRGYRCKKVRFQLGVSDESVAPTGRVTVRQGSKTLVDLTMTQGDPAVAETTAVRDSLSPSSPLMVRVDAHPVGAAPETPQDIRFILANGKVFCTFPSVNLRN